MRIIVRQIPPAGGARKLVVNREKLDTLRTPPWWTRPARFVVSWFGLAVALCAHAFGVAAVALWPQSEPVEVSAAYEIKILPDMPLVEACSALPDSGDGHGEPDNTKRESVVATEAAGTLSNYWDLVRAAIAGRVQYPRDAIRQGIEGTIDLQLTLDAQGALVAVVPLELSPGILVQSAVNAARRAAPFPPNTNGSSDRASAILPVHFQLNRNPERKSPE